MTIYEGERTLRGSLVTADGAPLSDRRDIADWSRTGFEWGFVGPGPRQLALALLAHYTGDPHRARTLAEPFMHSVVASLDNVWQLDSSEIEAELDAKA